MLIWIASIIYVILVFAIVYGVVGVALMLIWNFIASYFNLPTVTWLIATAIWFLLSMITGILRPRITIKTNRGRR